MRKSFFAILFFVLLSFFCFSQEVEKDSFLIDLTYLEEVTVKSIKLDKNKPFTFTNISQEEIAPRNLGQDIPILLNFLPSVVTTSDAGAGVGYTGIRIRGSEARSIQVTINGIPYNDSESQGVFWVNLPDFATSLEEIQVQRGVGSSTNGVGTFGASIHLTTNKVSKDPFVNFANSFGSFNTKKHTFNFSTGVLKNNFEFSGRLSKIDSDGYIERAGSDLKSYFLQGAYKNKNTFLKALAFGGHEITQQAWFGISPQQLEIDRKYNPAGEIYDVSGNNIIGFYDNTVDNYKQNHYQLHWNQIFNDSWNISLGLNLTQGKGFFENYENNVIVRRWLDNDFYVANFSLNYTKNNLDIASGILYSDYIGNHFDERVQTQLGVLPNQQTYENKGEKKEQSIFIKGTFFITQQLVVFLDNQLRLLNYKTDGIVEGGANLNIKDNFIFF